MMPIPAIKPVINLIALVLSLLQNACVRPSSIVGIIRKNVIPMFKTKTFSRNNGKLIYPK
jgi:hypothetical protein